MKMGTVMVWRHLFINLMFSIILKLSRERCFLETGRQFGETRQIVMGYDVTWFNEYMPVCTGMSATIHFRQGEVVENA